MLRTRVIPVLLIERGRLVKTVNFKNPVYVGDPINAIKIFNEKEVDEIIIVDMSAGKAGGPDIKHLSRMAKEAFMPMSYCGGIKTIDDASVILNSGFEKVGVNTSLISFPGLITEIADSFGSQSIIASIDAVKKITGKYAVYCHCTGKTVNVSPADMAKKAESFGAGEIVINSVDRDGKMNGYDINVIKSVSQSVNIPVIALGGAATILDFADVVFKGGADAVAAGSMFVFHGVRKAVLITYPDKKELKGIFEKP